MSPTEWTYSDSISLKGERGKKKDKKRKKEAKKAAERHSRHKNKRRHYIHTFMPKKFLGRLAENNFSNKRFFSEYRWYRPLEWS